MSWSWYEDNAIYWPPSSYIIERVVKECNNWNRLLIFCHILSCMPGTKPYHDSL